MAVTPQSPTRLRESFDSDMREQFPAAVDDVISSEKLVRKSSRVELRRRCQPLDRTEPAVNDVRRAMDSVEFRFADRVDLS